MINKVISTHPYLKHKDKTNYKKMHAVFTGVSQRTVVEIEDPADSCEEACAISTDDEHPDCAEETVSRVFPSTSRSTSHGCKSTCCQVLEQNSPFQPTDKHVLKSTEGKQGSRHRFFSPHWYKTFPWLTVCTARGKVFCWYCTHMSLSASGTALLSKRQENVFTETGFDNWKKASEKFTPHSQSNLHREAMMKWQHRKQAGIDTIMENACRSEQLYRRQMLIKQMESLQFLLKQGLAIRGHDEVDGNLYQLLLLRSNECPQLKTWLADKNCFSPDNLNEQITIMGGQLARSLLEDIRKPGIFSLLADEAADVCNKEQLCVCVSGE